MSWRRWRNFLSIQRQELSLGRLLLAFTAVTMICTAPALAVPDCWGVIALNNQNDKVARITCKDDHAPGGAQSYVCSFKWKVRNTDGVVGNLASSFSFVRGEPEGVKFEESRVEGKPIDDEVDGMSMSCGAKP